MFCRLSSLLCSWREWRLWKNPYTYKYLIYFWSLFAQGTLLALDTWGFDLIHIFTIPLICTAVSSHCLVVGEPVWRNDARSLLAKSFVVYGTARVVSMLVTTVFVALERRHLMVRHLLVEHIVISGDESVQSTQSDDVSVHREKLSCLFSYKGSSRMPHQAPMLMMPGWFQSVIWCNLFCNIAAQWCCLCVGYLGALRFYQQLVLCLCDICRFGQYLLPSLHLKVWVFWLVTPPCWLQ